MVKFQSNIQILHEYYFFISLHMVKDNKHGKLSQSTFIQNNQKTSV